MTRNSDKFFFISALGLLLRHWDRKGRSGREEMGRQGDGGRE